jgi:hypothetical protein
MFNDRHPGKGQATPKTAKIDFTRRFFTASIQSGQSWFARASPGQQEKADIRCVLLKMEITACQVYKWQLRLTTGVGV